MPNPALTMNLEQLLSQRADLWRGRGAPAAVPGGVSTGFAALDDALTWRGWPPGSLAEIITDHHGAGFWLLLPMLAILSRQPRWLMLVEPPLIPYAPALAARGLDLARLVVVHTGDQAPWAMEQGLRSGACAAVLAWDDDRDARAWPVGALRRLQLAAAAGDAQALLMRPPSAAGQPSPATLRLGVQTAPEGIAIEVLKQRGGRAGASVVIGGDRAGDGDARLDRSAGACVAAAAGARPGFPAGASTASFAGGRRSTRSGSRGTSATAGRPPRKRMR